MQLTSHLAKRSLGFIAGRLRGDYRSKADCPRVFIANAVKEFGDGKQRVIAKADLGRSGLDHVKVSSGCARQRGEKGLMSYQ
jgi:hypothetical protein